MLKSALISASSNPSSTSAAAAASSAQPTVKLQALLNRHTASSFLRDCDVPYNCQIRIAMHPAYLELLKPMKPDGSNGFIYMGPLWMPRSPKDLENIPGATEAFAAAERAMAEAHHLKLLGKPNTISIWDVSTKSVLLKNVKKDVHCPDYQIVEE